MSKRIIQKAQVLQRFLTNDHGRVLLKMFVVNQQANWVIKLTSNNQEVYV